MRSFSETIENLELCDTPLLGAFFNWREGIRNQPTSRIDRFLFYNEWSEWAGSTTQFVLPWPTLYHASIILEIGGLSNGPTPNLKI